MNCNGRRLALFTLLFAAVGLLWSFTAYAGPGHIIGPVGAPELVCDGIDDDSDGSVDDGFHDADMAFFGGDAVADCIDAGDADGDGVPDNLENPDGIWGNADDYGSSDDPDTDDDGLLDGQEDANQNGNFDGQPNECNVTDADTDGDGINDGLEGMVDSADDPDADVNCNDTESDGDGITDGNEDLDFDGNLDPNECNPYAANTDGVSANDGVGNEGFTDTDGDGIANCQDTNNDNDGLTDNIEDDGFGGGVANDGQVNGGECNLIVANTDGVSANDGVGGEGAVDTDGDNFYNCADTNNDGDGLNDNVEDLNGNGVFNLGNNECDLNNANTDGVSANDGVGSETMADLGPPDNDTTPNCADNNNDGDGLTDDIEDDGFGGGVANDGQVNGGECDLIVANTDGVSANDGVGGEGAVDTDGDNFYNCADNNNDNDGGRDDVEDDNGNGITDGLECNMNVANSDGQGALDYVGNEGEADQPAPDVDNIRNCQDLDNDQDGLLDGAEDLNANGVFDGPNNECNLIVVNTDGVNGNDGHADEGMADTDGDGRPNCNDQDNDNDGLIDTVDPTPNAAFNCANAIRVRYLINNVRFTAPNQLRIQRVRITRNIVGRNVRLDSIDPTGTSPDIADVTNVTPALPRTITGATTFTVTLRGPANPHPVNGNPITPGNPVNVPFPVAEFIPAFPGGVGDGQGADRLDYTFNCGTYIALSEPERLELRDLRSYSNSGQLVFEALGQGVKSVNVQLYDISGRTVLQAEANGSLVIVPLTSSSHRLSNGIYLAVLTVRGWDGQIVNSELRKVVVKR